jgi:hypothetical protein
MVSWRPVLPCPISGINAGKERTLACASLLIQASNTPLSKCPRFDQRSNGSAAELVVANVRELIRRNEMEAAD